MKFVVWVINGGRRVAWKYYSRQCDCIQWGRRMANKIFDDGECAGTMLIEIRDIVTDEVIRTVEPW